MKSWFSFTAQAAAKKAELLIYGVISDWENNAKDFAAQMAAIPADHELTVGINCRGGDVFGGYAIAGMVERRGAITRCDGICASMGSVIFVVGKKRIMPANGMIMIHRPSGYVPGESGTSEDLRKHADDSLKTAETLDKIGDGLVATYVAKTGKTEKEVRAKMDAETWFTAQEANDFGLCDEISGAVEITNAIDLDCFRNAPKNFSPKNKTEDAGRTGNEPPNPANIKMKSLLVALAAVGLIPSADAAEDVAVSTFQKNFAPIKAAADEAVTLRQTIKDAQAKAADAFVAQAIKDGKCKDEEKPRAGLKALFLASEEQTRALIGDMPTASTTPRGAAPIPSQTGKTKPAAAGDERTEETVRAEMAEENDPAKRAILCRELRGFRGHKGLFGAVE